MNFIVLTNMSFCFLELMGSYYVFMGYVFLIYSK